MINEEELGRAITEATEALNGATNELTRERRVRKVQISLVTLGLFLVASLGFLEFRNSQEIADRAKEAEQANCLGINESRSDIRKVLTIVFSAGQGARSADEQEQLEALMASIEKDVLQPLDCQ